ncbi:MAG: phosphatase PAP2/dual specificity phosphatase family protein [Opitutaceae bacterium]|nr:phosphatase PAP2/dual specificity phosphatase family protein [Opitutaceae bacterium]
MTRTRFIRTALTSAALSVLFLVVYSGCNILTGWRSDVGTIAFAWERFIPFVPLMIVPYMSIDAFFVVAPFLCAGEDERQRFARRITMAILVAGLFFLVFPLRFAFERPAAGGGMLGAVFDWFRTMDQPFNLAPSLHIALRTILAEHYHRHTRGMLRAASHVWFFLIGLSTLLVWQHHLADVATGFILGGFCLFAFPESDAPRTVVANRRIGLIYACGAFVVLAFGWLLRPWGVFALWPVLSLGVMALANFRAGAAIFQKHDGRLPWRTRLALAPVLAGQWLSLRHYARQCRPWDAVTTGVWLGRVLNEREAREAIDRGVTAVLDLTGEFSESNVFLRTTRYRNVPVLDLTAPTPAQLRATTDFIAAESARGVVYVHCKIGYSRSAAAVGAWLLASGRARSVEEVVAQLVHARPSIVIRPEVRRALAEFATGNAA